MATASVIIAQETKEFIADGIFYYITGEKQVRVVANSKLHRELKGTIIIPSSVYFEGKTYSVTEIGMNAFSSCDSLISVEISEGIASINRWGFSGCRNLTNIKFPQSLTFIGMEAFANCSKLQNVSFPENLNFDSGSFKDCYSLTSITLPNKIVRIDRGLFANCRNLTEVVFPKNLESISDNAFENCNLVRITFPSRLYFIGERAFAGNSNLTDIVFPSSLKEIRNQAFLNCKSLLIPSIPNGIKIGTDIFAGCQDLEYLAKKMTVSDTVIWRGVKERDNILEYEKFIKDFPESGFVNQATERIIWLKANPAEVKIEYPESVKTIPSPYVNVSGRIYEWKTVFRETSGKYGYTLRLTEAFVQAPNGTIYTQGNTTKVTNGREIKVSKKGSDIYNHWISSSDNWNGGTYHLVWEGKDDIGNPIVIKQIVHLEK